MNQKNNRKQKDNFKKKQNKGFCSSLPVVKHEFPQSKKNQGKEQHFPKDKRIQNLVKNPKQIVGVDKNWFPSNEDPTLLKQYELEMPPLLYKYPEANPKTWLNIAQEMIKDREFFVKVCHLMNMMNMHPPFVQDFTSSASFLEKVSEDKQVMQSLAKSKSFQQRANTIIERISDQNNSKKRDLKSQFKESQELTKYSDDKRSKNSQKSGIAANVFVRREIPILFTDINNNTDALLAKIESELDEHSDSNIPNNIIDQIIETETKSNKRLFDSKTVELFKMLRNTIKDKTSECKQNKARLVDLKKKFQKYGQGTNRSEDFNENTNSMASMKQLNGRISYYYKNKYFIIQ